MSNQYNRQIDEAYLLLGKARYFDRQISSPLWKPSIFLLESGAKSQHIYVEGKIWREKTNIRLTNPPNWRLENSRTPCQSIDFIARKQALPFGQCHPVAEAFIQPQGTGFSSDLSSMKRAALFAAPNENIKARYLFHYGSTFLRLLNSQIRARWAISADSAALKEKSPEKIYLYQCQSQTNPFSYYITRF